MPRVVTRPIRKLQIDMYLTEEEHKRLMIAATRLGNWSVDYFCKFFSVEAADAVVNAQLSPSERKELL